MHKVPPGLGLITFLIVMIWAIWPKFAMRGKYVTSTPPGMTRTTARVSSREEHPGNISLVRYEYAVNGTTYNGLLRFSELAPKFYNRGTLFAVFYIDARPNQSFVAPQNTLRPYVFPPDRMRVFEFAALMAALTLAMIIVNGVRFGFGSVRTWLSVL